MQLMPSSNWGIHKTALHHRIQPHPKLAQTLYTTKHKNPYIRVTQFFERPIYKLYVVGVISLYTGILFGPEGCMFKAYRDTYKHNHDRNY